MNYFNYEMKTYCLVCKKNTENNKNKKVKSNGRLMMKSTCLVSL